MPYKEFKLQTRKQEEWINITDNILAFVNESYIKEGQILVQSLHTTTSIIVTENEPNLLEDFIEHLERQVSQVPKNFKYRHDTLKLRGADCPEDEPENAMAHIKTALYGQISASLILRQGKPKLGKYQSIFFVEFDGPCPRKHKTERVYAVSIVGERD